MFQFQTPRTRSVCFSSCDCMSPRPTPGYFLRPGHGKAGTMLAKGKAPKVPAAVRRNGSRLQTFPRGDGRERARVTRPVRVEAQGPRG